MLDLLKQKKILLALLLTTLSYLFIDLVLLPPKTHFPDESTYLQVGKNLANNKILATPNGDRAFVMPLPAALYGLIYKIVESDPVTIIISRVIQAFVMLLTGLGIAWITHILFKNKISTITSLIIVLFYPSLVAFQAVLLSECLFIFFLVGGFAFLFHWQDSLKKWSFVLSMLFFCGSLYTRPMLMYLSPILVVCALFSMKMEMKEKMKYIALSCAIFVVCMSPWWVRNYRVFNSFVPFTLSNWNLYLGNNPANTTASIDGDGVDYSEVEKIHALNDELATSRAFGDKAKAYIIENPGVFLHNAWLKFKRFWNFTSNYQPTESQKTFFMLYNISLLLSWLPVFCLALVSFALNWRMWQKLLPIYCLIGYYTFVHVVVIASLRYRLPIEPFFIVMAADVVRRAVLFFENIRVGSGADKNNFVNE